jgi:hypothetical protein
MYLCFFYEIYTLICVQFSELSPSEPPFCKFYFEYIFHEAPSSKFILFIRSGPKTTSLNWWAIDRTEQSKVGKGSIKYERALSLNHIAVMI